MTPISEENHNQKRQDCWNSALHSFGYSYLYNLKAKNLQKILKFNTFLGILIPVLIGGVVTTYGTDSYLLKLLIYLVAPFSIIQLIISIYIVSYNLEDKYSYFLESSHDNSEIAKSFENLGKYPPTKLKDLDNEFQKIQIRRNNRDLSDNKYPISDKQKRKGMRYSLRNYRRRCVGCNEIPLNMIPSSCPVCGNF